MRGLLKAAALLAPALATAAALPTEQDASSPPALVYLNLPETADHPDGEVSLHLQVQESAQACGSGNVTINGQSLAQDGNGMGSGTIMTDLKQEIVASWVFKCLGSDVDEQEQSIEFDVLSFDGKEVEDVSFLFNFKQTAPVTFGWFMGTNAVIIPGSREEEPCDGHGDGEPNRSLDDELFELELLKLQRIDLEHAIFMKEKFIAEAFGRKHSPMPLADCDSLKCVVETMFNHVKHAAGRLYGAVGGSHGHFDAKGAKFPFPWHGKNETNWPFPHHGNHTHGNHSSPHPPFHKPHFPPPFCHCEPHKKPDHPPPGHKPHHPPGDKPHHPPGDKEPGEDADRRIGAWDEKPHHHQGDDGARGNHHKGGFHEKHADGDEHRDGGFRGEHAEHHGPPGRRPPHGVPQPMHDSKPHHHPGGESNHPPMDFGDADRKPELPIGEIPPPPLDDEHMPPGPPPEDFPGRHGGPGPAMHHGDRHGPHGPHSGVGRILHKVAHAPIFRILATVIVLGFLFSAVRTRCFRQSREQRRARREERRQAHAERRRAFRERRSARRGMLKAKLRDLVVFIKSRVMGSNVEDEEKEAILRRLHGCENDEDDNISTTMEQEIAQLRTVAGVVGDMVLAEEGRMRNRMETEAAQRAPPSPHGSFPDYISVDEALPAYDESTSNNTSNIVADGIRYTPGSTMYTPGSDSETSSLDEELGRKD